MKHAYAIFAARFAPLIGGVESYVDNLAHELALEGHEVVVVTSNLSASPDREVREDGVEIVRLPALSLLGGRLPLPRRNAEHRRLLDHIAEKGVDRILVNNRFYGHSFDGLAFAERLGMPTVVLDHGSDYLTLGNPLLDKAIQRYEHVATGVVKQHDVAYCGVSSKSVEWLRMFGIHDAQVVPNAIDGSSFRAASSGRDFRTEMELGEDAALITFVGRLAPEKGADRLVRAASAFEGRDVSFALAGDGPMRDRLEKEAGANVHLLGPLAKGDVSALLQSSDAFCLPTRSEGFCTVLLEASACGLPSAVPDVGGVDEVLRASSTGVIMPDASEESIVGAVAELLDLGASGRREMGSIVRDYVDGECSWAKSAELLAAVFESAENKSPAS